MAKTRTVTRSPLRPFGSRTTPQTPSIPSCGMKTQTSSRATPGWVCMIPTIRPKGNIAATSVTSEVANSTSACEKGESILARLPLVFWNAGRIAIGTDGKYLTPSGLPSDPNPLRYDPNARRSIARAETSSGNISDGVVMWYRAEIAKGPTDDSEGPGRGVDRSQPRLSRQ